MKIQSKAITRNENFICLDGFNLSHTLAYSLIGLQELNLAYRFPILYWDCACLIADSGGNEDNSEDEQEEESVEVEYYYNEMEEFTEEDNEEDIDDSYEEEDCDRYPAKVVVMKNGKKKKKTKTVNYGKILQSLYDNSNIYLNRKYEKYKTLTAV